MVHFENSCFLEFLFRKFFSRKWVSNTAAAIWFRIISSFVLLPQNRARIMGSSFKVLGLMSSAFFFLFFIFWFFWKSFGFWKKKKNVQSTQEYKDQKKRATSFKDILRKNNDKGCTYHKWFLHTLSRLSHRSTDEKLSCLEFLLDFLFFVEF